MVIPRGRECTLDKVGGTVGYTQMYYIFRHGDVHFPRTLDRGKKKNSWEKEGRDWKEIKGRRAGNRRRGGKERKVLSSSSVGRRNWVTERYTEVGQSRGKIRGEWKIVEKRKLRGNYEWWIDEKRRFRRWIERKQGFERKWKRYLIRERRAIIDEINFREESLHPY